MVNVRHLILEIYSESFDVHMECKFTLSKRNIKFLTYGINYRVIETSVVQTQELKYIDFAYNSLYIIGFILAYTITQTFISLKHLKFCYYIVLECNR